MISYPIALPASPQPRVLTPTGQSVSNLTTSPFTGEQQVQRTPAEILTFDVDLPPMTAVEGEDYVASLLSLNGLMGTFYLGNSSRAVPRGVATGTPLVSGSQNGVGSRLLCAKGWTPSITGIMKAGDWIGLGGGYNATRIKTSGGSATAKYVVSLGGSPPALGAPYWLQIRVKNIGTKPVIVLSSLNGGGTINPGMQGDISVPNTGNGTNTPGILFSANTISDSLDFIVWDPQIRRFGYDENILSDDQKLFIAGAGSWATVGGATVTLTQGLTQRLHKLIADANSDAGGNAELLLFPPLRYAPTDGEPITVSAPTGVFRMTDDAVPWTIDQATNYGLKFKAMEAF